MLAYSGTKGRLVRHPKVRYRRGAFTPMAWMIVALVMVIMTLVSVATHFL